jgi:hypothetical protein
VGTLVEDDFPAALTDSARRAEAPTRRPEGGVSALDDDPGAAEPLNVVHDTSASPRRSTRVMGANPPRELARIWRV